MYKTICKENQVETGQNDHIVIVTGWTPKKKISSKLSKEDYAAIGQLYSPRRGITALCRNLLANPSICSIAILNATKEDENAGGCECLADFFEYGFFAEDGRWRIESEVEGYIEGDIGEDALEDLRKGVQINLYTNTAEMLRDVQEHNLYFGIEKRKEYHFPEPKRKDAAVLPGELYGHRIQGKTVAETWVKILHRIRTNGTPRPTGYDGTWQEIIDLTAIVTDEPRGGYFPDPNYMPCTPESMADYYPQMLEDKEYEDGVKYTYGQRIFSWFGQNQFEKVADKLAAEIDSASGVICLWDSGSGTPKSLELAPSARKWYELSRPGRKEGDSDHDHGGSPCLNHIWFRIVDGVLSMTALFRSNDMFAAWCFNAMGLRALQGKMLDALIERGFTFLELGALITISQSAHIYEDCNDSADRIIKQHYLDIIRQERKDYYDPCGNFIVRWKDGVIYVDQTTPAGDFVRIYSHRIPLNLIRTITSANPTLGVEHAAYIAHEITKCYFLQDIYQQDQ